MGGLRFRKPSSLSRALIESPTPRPSPKNGEGRAAGVPSYCRIRSEEGWPRWRRFAASTRKAGHVLFVEGGRAYRKSRGALTCARHAGTAQPNFKPPRAIEQAVGPDG